MIWATLSPQIACLGLERDSGEEVHDLLCYDSYDPGHYGVSYNVIVFGLEPSVSIENKYTHTHNINMCTHKHAQFSYHNITAY